MINQKQSDFEDMPKVLEARYKMLTTRGGIYNGKTQKWHIFLNLGEKT
jgi:hypothetical protein